MIIFFYTFILIFFAMVLILGLGSILTDERKAPQEPEISCATAAMCTTRLLGKDLAHHEFADDDFVVEQDLVYTYDSINL